MRYKLHTFTRLLIVLVPFLAAPAPAQVLEPQGGEFQVSAQTTLYSYAPSVAMQDSGDFVIVWHADREAASGTDVLARRYASDGSSLGGLAVEQVMPYAFTVQGQGGDDTLDSDVDPMTGLSPDFPVSGRQRVDAGQTNGLGDFVWLDEDGDGVQDASEPGIAGVVVDLIESGVAPIAQTSTDSQGRYLFADLTPGTYSLSFTAPADFAFAAQDQGGDEALDSDVDPVTGETPSFLFDNSTIDLEIDAGLEPAMIGNRVWLDEDADGLQDEGESGLAGVTVRLLDAADLEVASTVTDADGLYGFLGVPTGDYRIEVILPIDGVFSSQDVGGDDLIDSDVDPATGRSALFSYQAASASRTWDAGLRLLPFFADGFESGDFSAWSGVAP